VTRIRRSWELFKTSWGVLRSDKTLAAIPAISAVMSLIALAGFGGLFYALGIDTGSDKEGTEAIDAIGYVIAAVAYAVFAFITVYFQAALVAGANERLEGGDATVGKSIGVASGKLHRILPWALVTATVSFILSQLERQGWVGQIVANLLGMAWAVLTFLTIPIIMLEDVGPIAALKRSATLFKQTWGENVVAQAGFGLFGFVAILPAIAVGALGIASGSGVVAGVAIGIAVAWIAIVMVVLSALSGIYRTALYRYAVDDQAPPAFSGTDLSSAFQPRRGRFN
jgi:Family of unknown function (DUF6159)